MSACRAGTCCMRSCWRKPGRRRWTTGARGPRVSSLGMLAKLELELKLKLELGWRQKNWFGS